MLNAMQRIISATTDMPASDDISSTAARNRIKIPLQHIEDP